ncbi:MAG: dihydroorotate dehydrogenase (quinone), partial [Verrucomicrobiota bacterium]
MDYIYEKLVRPFLFRMEPEKAHELGRKVLIKAGAFEPLCSLMRRYNMVCEEKPIDLFGLQFPNRVGLAAGMDKDGEFPRAMEALGFGHTEVGTVTPE